jgi:hypothetical protein
MMFLLFLVGAVWADAQCACICNDQLYAPVTVPDCSKCDYAQCLTANANTLCTRLNATVQPACNPVVPCAKAFESTLCIQDRSLGKGLNCLDQRGLLDPWQLNCLCGPIAATCLALNECPFPDDLKRQCVAKCGAAQCEPQPDSSASAPTVAAAALALALALALSSLGGGAFNRA